MMLARDEPTVVILFRPDGSIQVEAVGHEGPACKEATRPYESALGLVTDDRPKPEMASRALRTGATRRDAETR